MRQRFWACFDDGGCFGGSLAVPATKPVGFFLFLVLAGCVFRRTISSCSGLSASCLLIFCGILVFVLKKVIVIMSKSCVEVKFVQSSCVL